MTVQLNETRFGPKKNLDKQANTMTFITHGFRVSVVSDIQERVRDLESPLRFMLRRSLLVECVTQNVFTMRRMFTLSCMSDTTETRNPCVIKVIVLACFTYIDNF
jgi:hypothetical protein